MVIFFFLSLCFMCCLQLLIICCNACNLFAFLAYINERQVSSLTVFSSNSSFSICIFCCNRKLKKLGHVGNECSLLACMCDSWCKKVVSSIHYFILDRMVWNIAWILTPNNFLLKKIVIKQESKSWPSKLKLHHCWNLNWKFKLLSMAL